MTSNFTTLIKQDNGKKPCLCDMRKQGLSEWGGGHWGKFAPGPQFRQRQICKIKKK
jgi:hypothetical protein